MQQNEIQIRQKNSKSVYYWNTLEEFLIAESIILIC